MGTPLNGPRIEGVALFVLHLFDDFLFQFGPQKLPDAIKIVPKEGDFEQIQ